MPKVRETFGLQPIILSPTDLILQVGKTDPASSIQNDTNVLRFKDQVKRNFDEIKRYTDSITRELNSRLTELAFAINHIEFVNLYQTLKDQIWGSVTLTTIPPWDVAGGLNDVWTDIPGGTIAAAVDVSVMDFLPVVEAWHAFHVEPPAPALGGTVETIELRYVTDDPGPETVVGIPMTFTAPNFDPGTGDAVHLPVEMPGHHEAYYEWLQVSGTGRTLRLQARVSDPTLGGQYLGGIAVARVRKPAKGDPNALGFGTS